MISSLIKNSIPSMNTESGILPSAHHPALFFIHSGISKSSANAVGIDIGTKSIRNRKTPINNKEFFIIILFFQPTNNYHTLIKNKM